MAFLVGLAWAILGYVQAEPHWSLVGGIVASVGLILVGFLAGREDE